MEAIKKSKFKPLGENQGRLLVCIPNELYNNFKSYCKTNNVKMASMIRQLITEKLEK